MSAWCAPETAGRKGISCLVVEKGTPGLSFGAHEKKLGWKSQPTAMVMFENCRVPVANRIGAEGDGFRIAMSGLDGGRLNIARLLDRRRAALPRPHHRLHARPQAVRPASRRFPGAAVSARRHGHRAGGGAADGPPRRRRRRRSANPARTRLAAMAKRFATDAGFEIVNGCLQLHGGYGYLTRLSRSSGSCATCACTRSSKEPTRSCA